MLKQYYRRFCGALSSRSEGVALLFVLWMLTVLTVVVGQFCFTMKTENNMTRNFLDVNRALFMAKGGTKLTIFQLMKRSQAGDDDVLLRVNGHNDAIKLPGGEVDVRIENSSGRVNLNTASEALLRLLFSGCDLNNSQLSVIVDSIQDWRDRDSSHRLNGAENDYYQSLPSPYPCRNGPFMSKRELLKIKGMNRDIFNKVEGRITVMPFFFKPDARKRNRLPGGQKKKIELQRKININAAPPDVLLMLPGMNKYLAGEITYFRADGDFKSFAELQAVIGVEVFQRIARFVDLTEIPVYTIIAVGRVQGSMVKKKITTTIYCDYKNQTYRILRQEVL